MIVVIFEVMVMYFSMCHFSACFS